METHAGPLTRRRLLAAVAVSGAALATGCSGSGGESPASAGSAAATRTVDHPLGTTEISSNPTKVICLDAGITFQTALEVGAPVIAAETLAGDVAVPSYLPQPPADFVPLGFNEQNLEQLVELAPDLIIGSRVRLEENYDQLDKIAPTVAVENSADGVAWRDAARSVADLLGAAKVIEERITAFEEKADAFTRKHAADLADQRVALVRFADDVRILTGSVFPVDLLALFGVQRPKSNTPPDEETTYISLSREEIPRLNDADLILHLSGGGGFTKESGGTSDEVTSGSLWKRLDAVAGGRTFELDAVTWWDGNSVSAAEKALADLDRILSDV